MKISNLKKSAKTRKNLKKTAKKKLQFFFCLGPFTLEEDMSLIKKACFILIFFQFEEFSILFFFLGSIQPQHTVRENHYFRLPLQYQYLDQNQGYF